jgi:hypothetical protein
MVLLSLPRAERQTFISKYAGFRSASARRTYFWQRLVLIKCHCSVNGFACPGALVYRLRGGIGDSSEAPPSICCAQFPPGILRRWSD